jgi:BRCA1-associated protein
LLQLETQRVWDYAGDGYVHRLIQNKADGKLVELPAASSAPNTPAGKGSYSAAASGDMVPSEKIESIGLEYSYLLTSQLESQRFYYEDKIHGLQMKLDDVVQRESDVKLTARRTEETLAAVREELQAGTKMVKQLQVDKAKADKRAEKAVELARTLQRDLQAEQSVSQGLHKKVEILREEGTVTKAKVADLEEQMRDLMFFVSAREKIGQSEELAGGDVEVGPASKGKKKKGK